MNELLGHIQRSIESVYRIETPEEVERFCLERHHVDFFVSDELKARREVLLIRDEGEHANIGLYLAEEVRQRADRFARRSEWPDAEGSFAHIDDFCVVLEGVSHFVYLTYCGGTQDRPVSRLELELQAELDKFILLRLAAPIPNLVDRLFSGVRYHEELDPQEHERYRIANDRAKRYARWMDREIDHGRTTEVLADARRLIRRPMASKLDHIQRTARVSRRAA